MIIPTSKLQIERIGRRVNPDDLVALERVQDSLKEISRHSWDEDAFDVRFRIGGIEASAQVRGPSTAVVRRECQKVIDDHGQILEIKQSGGG